LGPAGFQVTLEARELLGDDEPEDLTAEAMKRTGDSNVRSISRMTCSWSERRNALRPGHSCTQVGWAGWGPVTGQLAHGDEKGTSEATPQTDE